MDPELQKRIDEAKAEGYNDEEIAKALGMEPPAPQATLPNSPTVPILSAEEKAAFQQADKQTAERNTGENYNTAAAGAAAVTVGGLGTYGAYKGLQSLGQKIMQPVAPGPTPAPTAPIAPQAAAARPMPTPGTSNVYQLRPVAPQPSMTNQVRQAAASRIMPAMGQAGQMAGQVLSKAAPLMRGANIAGAAMYSGGLNTNEEEELRKRRMMQPTITR